MNLPDLNVLSELVHWSAREYGDLPALAGARSVEALTFAELGRRVSAGAAVLSEFGLSAQEPVLLILDASPGWGLGLFSILEAGLVAVPLAAETTPRAVASIVARTGCRTVLCSSRTVRLSAEAEAVKLIHIEQLLDAHGNAPISMRGSREDVALLAFTSGSMQQPRAVELTHGNLLANLRALMQVRYEGPGAAMLSMLPPAHLFELMGGLLCPLARGARVMYAGSLLPNRLVDAVRDQKITHALAVPALVDCLYREVLGQLLEAGVVAADRLTEPREQIARRLRDGLGDGEVGQLRDNVRQRIGAAFDTLVVGGAAIEPALAELIAALGIRVEVGYGLTEASPVVTVGVIGDCPAGSVGRPLPGVEVRIGTNGEILVRGPNVMRGYFKDKEATAEAIVDGWLHTGDSGYLDASGFLFVTGRLKEAIVTASGRTVHPEEIEPYYRDPLFAEWCAGGLRGEHGNDVPALFVVAASSSTSDEELERAFVRLRSQAPAAFRLERLVRLADRLPRTATGKIRRRPLAQQFS